MGLNCPPQLYLSLQTTATSSFKHSLEQYGFDLESPMGHNTDARGSSGSNGNKRSKRARSSSSSSDGNKSSSSTISSESSKISPVTENSSPNSSTSRLIDMPDYAIDEQPFVPNLMPQTQHQQQPQQMPEDRYRLSLEVFHTFDGEISVLRQPQTFSPPSLPPVNLSNNEPRIPFLHLPPRPTTPLSEAFFSHDSPSNTRVQSPTTVSDNSVYEELLQVTESSTSAQFRFRDAYPLSVLSKVPASSPPGPSSASRVAGPSSSTDSVSHLLASHPQQTPHKPPSSTSPNPLTGLRYTTANAKTKKLEEERRKKIKEGKYALEQERQAAEAAEREYEAYRPKVSSTSANTSASQAARWDATSNTYSTPVPPSNAEASFPGSTSLKHGFSTNNGPAAVMLLGLIKLQVAADGATIKSCSARVRAAPQTELPFSYFHFYLKLNLNHHHQSPSDKDKFSDESESNDSNDDNDNDNDKFVLKSRNRTLQGGIGVLGRDRAR
ncbi:hypothetical protein NLJ89_g5677 [Agrocybe chaxingu]|uniref:Uncharacterized protein n=1 Tax=Agrocybe chaxingu TaxID=84603 RepID=A0A9W8K044_9AGAR|nr:hypothetical protein NLJ89_g5677 [Agrocybe chaxingu]